MSCWTLYNNSTFLYILLVAELVIPFITVFTLWLPNNIEIFQYIQMSFNPIRSLKMMVPFNQIKSVLLDFVKIWFIPIINIKLWIKKKKKKTVFWWETLLVTYIWPRETIMRIYYPSFMPKRAKMIKGLMHKKSLISLYKEIAHIGS